MPLWLFLSPMRRAIQVTGRRRAVPLLPKQAHASPFRLSHSDEATFVGLAQSACHM